MPGANDERTFDGRTRWVRLPLSWAALVFVAVAVTTFAVSIENGRPAWQASSFALVAGSLAVVGVVVLDAIAGRSGVRIVVHVLPGLFVLSTAFLLTALQLADRFLPPLLYVVPVGLWVGGGSLVLGSVFVYRGQSRRLRRVAYVGLGASLVWGLAVVGYAVSEVLSRGWVWTSAVTAEGVAALFLLVALIGVPGLVFLWDLRETRPEGRGLTEER